MCINTPLLWPLITHRQTRLLRDREEQMDRSLMKNIIRAWKELRSVREQQHCTNTPLKLQIIKSVPPCSCQLSTLLFIGQTLCQWSCNVFVLLFVCLFIPSLLGDSGGVVNSLDFCLSSLKSLGCFYFRCIFSSQWKAVTVNLQILHCQLQRHFWRLVVRMCLASSNLLLML